MRRRVWLVALVWLCVAGCDEEVKEQVSPGPSGLEAFLVRYSACGAMGADGALAAGLLPYTLHLAGSGSFPGYAAIIDCGSNADDCEAFLHCLNGGTKLGACSGPSDPAHCDGTSLVRCVEHLPGDYHWYESPCEDWLNTGDEACVETATSAGCGQESCKPGTPPRCEGEVSYACVDGVDQPLDCAAFEMTCVEDTGRCLPPGLDCPQMGTVCLGDHLYRCVSGQPVFDLDCAWLFPGATCVESPAIGAFCGEPGDSSPAYLFHESCEGDVARLCSGRFCRTFDCSTFLGAACVDLPGAGGNVRCLAPDWTPPDWD
jgi:hypothetical protein